MLLQRWDESLTTDQTTEVLFHLSESLLQETYLTKQHEDIAFLVKNRDIQGLCDYELSYEGLDDGDATNLRQILAFFTKRRDLSLLVDPAEEAWDKFVDSEILCSETNAIFRLVEQGGFYFPLDVESVLHGAQRKISQVLGCVPPLEGLKLKFGPGSTTQVKKKDASVRRKLAQKYCCSGEMVPRVSEVLSEMPKWVFGEPESPDVVLIPDLEIHPGRVDSVPKTAKTERTIVVEPSLNTMLQAGIGDYIARRLKTVGVDITNQGRNRALARVGSLTGALATLDLSSASDLNAKLFVRSLLPEEWYDFLSLARSGTVATPSGDYYALEKFSSMGNGYTFPLETLLFWALATESTKYVGSHGEVSVYGDDIICPVESVPLLEKVLHCVGHIVNRSKSFSSGPFRESCGADYLSGIDVRPFYVKDVLSGQLLFSMHNYFVRRGRLHLAQKLLVFLSKELKIWGPDGYGDGHLVGVYRYRNHHQELGWSGYTFETFTWKSPKRLYTLGADYVFPAYSIYVRSSAPDGSEDPNNLWLASLGWDRTIRPDNPLSVYNRDSNKRTHLEDALSGTLGYKRVKIYVLN